jgi:hypothetical protein
MHKIDKSSNIAAVGHSPEGIHVTFKSGQTFVYKGAPENHVEAVRSAASAGKYVNANLVGKYPASKI